MSPALPAFAAERRVRTLRIRAADAGAARRVAIALGDALHTASLPDVAGGRFVLIRRVQLGRIPAHASSATLSLLVERAVRVTAERALRFDLPGAGSAAAVMFPDRAAALVALARRHARHEPAGDWLWEQIVPGWRSARTRGDRWRLLLETAHSLESPIITAAEVAHHAVQDEIDALLSAVSAPLVARWMRVGGWEPLPDQPIAASDCASISANAERILKRASIGVNDPRLVWLGVMLAVRERPARAAISALPAKIESALRARNIEFPAHARRSAGPDVARHEPAGACRAECAHASASDSAGTSAAAKSSSRVRRPDAPSETPVPPGCEPGAQPDPSKRLTAADATSACAGLLFLVHVLRRLGFPAFLAVRPELVEADLPLRLLYFIGRRAGMTEVDPLAVALAERMGEAERGRVLADCDWRCVAWLAAVRGWCRRRGRLDWRAVVRRTGRVQTTRTQIDVFFEARQADVALRRFALDVDPGWVPWLGCIVRVHYMDTHELNR